MTTPLPTPSPSRFTPEQKEILGRVYTLILSWRRERLRLKNNPPQTTSDMTHPTNPSPNQSGDSHE
jgi:hypothetical protein